MSKQEGKCSDKKLVIYTYQGQSSRWRWLVGLHCWRWCAFDESDPRV